MQATNQLDAERRAAVQEVLLTRHRHQHQRKEGHKSMPAIRSMADIGRKASEKKIESMKGRRSSLAELGGALGRTRWSACGSFVELGGSKSNLEEIGGALGGSMWSLAVVGRT